ncbi:LysR family transcriptional regulator [Yoonia sp.]|nr:LysR family transcriptional regulator [Yoonia sp.]
MGQLEDLRLFVQIVEQGSVSKAADKLNIAKSAVSRRLGLLEDRYDAALIQRKPGQWAITDVGKELYQRALGVVSEADALDGDFAQTPHTVEGSLSISVAHEFGLTFLSPALIRFQKQHPDIQLNVTFDNRPVDLSQDNFDFAIRITTEVFENASAKRIGQSRHGIYASTGYLETHGTPMTAKDLKQHKLLYFGTTKRGEWAFQEADGRTTKITFKPVLGSNSGVFLSDAVRRGAGIVRLPDFVCQALVDSGEIVPVLENLGSPQLNIYLMHAEKRRFNRRMRLFSEEMQLACSASG